MRLRASKSGGESTRFGGTSLGVRAQRRHSTRSKSTPTPTIVSSLTGAAGREATSDWLKQVYKNRYSNRLGQLLRSARVASGVAQEIDVQRCHLQDRGPPR